MGSFLPDHIRTVSIQPVSAEDGEIPLAIDAESVLTEALRDTFVEDNSLRVESSGDARLETRIVLYRLGEQAGEAELEVRVDFEFLDRVASQTLAQGTDLTARTKYERSQDSSDYSAEAEAFVELSRQLAQQILERTIEGW